LLKTDFQAAARLRGWDASFGRGSSMKTLENENEFFPMGFLCKYTFIHFHYARREVLPGDTAPLA
jgi:hypothetical protein